MSYQQDRIDLESLTMRQLTYGVDSNWIAFTKDLDLQVKKVLPGRFENIIQEEKPPEYKDPPKPAEGETFTSNSRPNPDYIAYESMVKDHYIWKHRDDPMILKRFAAAVFGKFLSPASTNFLCNKAGCSDINEVLSKNDLDFFKIFKILKETHSEFTFGNKDQIFIELNKQLLLDECKANETLLDLKTRQDLILKKMERVKPDVETTYATPNFRSQLILINSGPTYVAVKEHMNLECQSFPALTPSNPTDMITRMEDKRRLLGGSTTVATAVAEAKAVNALTRDKPPASTKTSDNPPPSSCKFCIALNLPPARANHWQSDCPNKPAQKDADKQPPADDKKPDGKKKGKSDKKVKFHKEVKVVKMIHKSMKSVGINPKLMLSTTSNQAPSDIVLFDTQAETSCFNNKDLFAKLQPCQPISISGALHGGITVMLKGLFEPLNIEAYYLPQLAANLISSRQVKEAGNKVTYDGEQDTFTVINPANPTVSYVFNDCEGYNYCCKFKTNPANLSYVGPPPTSSSTVQNEVSEDENQILAITYTGTERFYTKAQVDKASVAHHVTRGCFGFTSLKNAVQITRNLKNCPSTEHDLRRGQELYGNSLPNLAGISHRQKGYVIDFDAYRLKEKELVILMDLFFVCSYMFLVALSHPINFVTAIELSTKSRSDIFRGTMKLIAVFANNGYRVKVAMTDHESCFNGLGEDMAPSAIKHETVEPGTHLSQVERYGRTLKDIQRKLVANLPYHLPMCMVQHLFYVSAQLKNLYAPRSASYTVPPKEILTGQQLDFMKECPLVFGSIVMIAPPGKGSNKVCTARSMWGIYVGPAGTINGGICVLDPQNPTGPTLTRLHYTETPLADHMRAIIQTWPLAPKEIEIYRSLKRIPIVDAPHPDDIENEPDKDPDETPKAHRSDETSNAEQPQKQILPEPTVVSPAIPPTAVASTENHKPSYSEVTAISPSKAAPEPSSAPTQTVQPAPTTVITSSAPAQAAELTGVTAPVPSSVPVNPSSATTVNQPTATVPTVERVRRETNSTYSRNSKGSYNPYGKDFVLKHLKMDAAIEELDFAEELRAYNLSYKQAVKQLGEECTRKALITEMMQILAKRVFHGVHHHELSNTQIKKTIRSNVNYKRKIDALGQFIKDKARLVAGGHQQDRNLFEDISSATVSITSVFILAALAAREGMHVVTIDIGGAYLLADMKDEQFMILQPEVAKVAIDLDPTYKEFLKDDGTITVQLDKALYGLIQSAKLWYDLIVRILVEMGFVQNPNDPCVFNLGTGVDQCTVCLHVDDFMIVCKDMGIINKIISELQLHCKELTINKGKTHEYLGMFLDFTKPGECTISTEKYIVELLKERGITHTAPTPADAKLFELGAGELLSDEQRLQFHTDVAKLLWIAKRTRPDILTAVTFLTTRVSAPTKTDQRKLTRVLKYLNGTIKHHLRLCIGKHMDVNCFVDASFAVHNNCRSHTGAVIQVGRAQVFFKSSKQKINAKSSTEAELIAISDTMSQAIWVKDFLHFQGYTSVKLKMFEDNKSTIAMIKKGTHTSEQTRHIKIRQYFCKDRIDQHEVTLEYMPTKRMTADLFTKPLQGKDFVRFRDYLLVNSSSK